MKIGIVCLVLAYVLSQFFRVFLAVLAPSLSAELGATPEDLARASGIWFLTFAAMQIPVGWALDTLGPRWISSGLLAVGAAGGALVFAGATTPLHIMIAMGLIGIGCSAVLMAAYYIFAKMYSPKIFATLAGMIIGIGSFGNLAASAPMALAVDWMGWRATMVLLAGVTALVALLVAIFVKNPKGGMSDETGSVLDLLKRPALWLIIPIMFVSYAPAAGLRGLWIAPYFEDVFSADLQMIGTVSLVMGVAMIAGNFLYGPMDRLFGTRKWVVLWGNVMGAVALAMLYVSPAGGVQQSALLFAAVGFFGSSFAVIMAHARSFFPSHLTGRGVTLMNLFGIGGAGLLQFFSGRVYQSAIDAGVSAEIAHTRLFLFFGVLLIIGILIYAFSEDRVS